LNLRRECVHFSRDVEWLRRIGLQVGLHLLDKKRHILVDTLGLLLPAIVHSAGIQDRDGGILLLATLFGQFPFLETLFADSAYQGPIFANALVKILRSASTSAPLRLRLHNSRPWARSCARKLRAGRGPPSSERSSARRLNAFAFAAHTTTVWMTSAAVTLGIAIPALVYAVMRVGAALYINCHSKA
jgi:hypothetical protein